LRANVNNFISHSNANVKTNSFINYNTASGFLESGAVDQKFRFFQVRLTVLNSTPAENNYILDKLNYTIDLKDKVFKQTKNIILTKGQSTDAGKDGIGFNYISTDFKTTPAVSVTVSNTRIGLIAVVSNVTTQYANVNLYFASNGAIVDSTNFPGKNESLLIDPGKLTIEAVGI
jgi:hypothetical protein